MSYTPSLSSTYVDLLRRYARARREAHEFRLSGEIDKALIAEQLAGEYVDLAAGDDHPSYAWERMIELCDALATSPTIHPLAAWERIVPQTREEKRRNAIAILNKRFPVESQEDRITLARKGYTDCTGWGEHIIGTADDCGISRGEAAALFDLLGPTEAFDGFVTGCEDGEGDFE